MGAESERHVALGATYIPTEFLEIVLVAHMIVMASGGGGGVHDDHNNDNDHNNDVNGGQRDDKVGLFTPRCCALVPKRICQRHLPTCKHRKIIPLVFRPWPTCCPFLTKATKQTLNSETTFGYHSYRTCLHANPYCLRAV